ncbi:MAG TPA: hypothetical protein VM681_02520 [Candidatus Thermoplasmatota archaeon]|nr:hypothetical protein [Candidatus Thermoplasmatota archaeon]
MRATVAIPAVAAAALLFGLSAYGLAHDLPLFFDPCHRFGQRDGILVPTEACPRVSGSSETREQALVRIAAVQGTLLSAASLGLAGALRDRWAWAAASAGAAGVLGAVLMIGASGVPVLAGAALMGAAAAALRRPPASPPRGLP